LSVQAALPAQRMCEFKFWLFSVYPLADGAVPQNASFVVLLPPLLKPSNRERRGAEA